MFLLLLVATLFGQIPAQQEGTVSGVLKDGNGKPVAGVRIAAVARLEAVKDSSTASAMAALAETDAEGRYTLEGIPPGRYYVAAGRVDRQTYFPGTPDMTAATDLLVGAGQKVSAINFVLSDYSAGRASMRGDAVVAVVVTVEGGGPLPVSGNGKTTAMGLTSPERAISAFPTIADGFLFVSGIPGTYRVVLENLPARYIVKSMMYRSIDLLTNLLQFGHVDPSIPIAPTLLPVQVLADLSTGNPPRYSPLTIVLAPAPPPQTKTGVRVSGRLNGAALERQTIYLSNIPGDLFADGTFEFNGVLPGRYSIVTRNSSPREFPWGGSVVVGERDIRNVVLSELSLTPKQRQLPEPRPAGGHAEGSVPLAGISGRVVEEVSQKPIVEGSVVIKSTDYYSDSFSIDSDGRYEIPALLPGKYELELQAFGHTTITRSIDVDDKDLIVDFAPRSLRP